jgi:hypothetical protein
VKRLHVWVAALALTNFLAGGAGGLLLSREIHPDYQAQGPFEDYQRTFLARFELSPERTRLFDALLRNYDKEIEDVRQEALETSMVEMEPRLISLGLRYRDMIRNHVLPLDQRDEFDRLAVASTWPTTDASRP